MLSLVAGMVNINGVLSLHTLTTNVTGHFAFFAEDFVESQYNHAVVFILYILFFLFGAFVCGFLVELVSRTKPSVSHAAPMILEMCTLVMVGFSGDFGHGFRLENEWIACALLFAMGLQNALVTKISKATVRTTHLTGLFTDLGIELSQLFFYNSDIDYRKLSRSIYLRMTIIIFFFMGCVLGGFLYHRFDLRALLFAAASLIIAMLYDNILYNVHSYWRKLTAR